MEHLNEEQDEPVSPMGQYFNSSALCIYIVGVLEFEVPIHDLQTFTLIKDVFLPINPRFSSIMVLSLSLFHLFSCLFILGLFMVYETYETRSKIKMERNDGSKLKSI